MEINRAFIQLENRGKLRIEESLVCEELSKIGISIHYYSSKHIRRRCLPLDDETLVVGNVDCIYGAMKQLNIPIPEANSYPSCLNHLLYREIKLEKLKVVESSLMYGSSFKKIFIKPAKIQKKFTGFVLESEKDLYKLSGVSKRLDVWCSSVVEWVSEWRVYVFNHIPKAISWYEGDSSVTLDTNVVVEAIKLLKNSENSPKSYAIDFGVLESGETALIEMNDGFAIGAYDVDAKIYTDVVVSRWQELLSQINN